MQADEVRQRLSAAQSVARLAGVAALEHYHKRSRLTVLTKGAQDRVSDADRAIEAQIRRQLTDRFPEDGFLGEEGGASDGMLDSGGGVWVVDPIDGTDCFLFGIPSWCISIAWVHRRQMTIGVVYDPIHDEMFAGALGQGAFLNGAVMKVANASGPGDGLVGIGYSTRIPAEQSLSAMRRLADAGGMFHRCGSGALSLAWVAAGRLIGYYEPHMNSWDCLAGLLLVREAGGWTNEFLDDDGLTVGNPAIAAAPGVIEHMQFVAGQVVATAEPVGATA